MTQVGHSNYDGLCLQLVHDAYQMAGVNLGTAYDPVDYWADNQEGYAEHAAPGGPYGTPPAGAILFSGAATQWSSYGHTAISLGNGTVVSSAAYPYAEDPPRARSSALSKRSPSTYHYLGYAIPGDLVTSSTPAPVASAPVRQPPRLQHQRARAGSSHPAGSSSVQPAAGNGTVQPAAGGGTVQPATGGGAVQGSGSSSAPSASSSTSSSPRLRVPSLRRPHQVRPPRRPPHPGQSPRRLSRFQHHLHHRSHTQKRPEASPHLDQLQQCRRNRGALNRLEPDRADHLQGDGLRRRRREYVVVRDRIEPLEQRLLRLGRRLLQRRTTSAAFCARPS